MVKYDEETAKRGRKHVVDLRGSKRKAKIGLSLSQESAADKIARRRKSRKSGSKAGKGSVLNMAEGTKAALGGKPGGKSTMKAGKTTSALRKSKKRKRKQVHMDDSRRATRAHMTGRGKRS